MTLRSVSRATGQLSVFLAFFLLWEIAVDFLRIKPVILPPPSTIFVTIATHWPYLMKHTWPTFLAVSGGFLFATVAGLLIAVAIAYSRWVSDLTYPFLVAAQVLPKIALAPLFLIWFGFGLAPKVVIAALVAFFPIVINTARGLQSVEPELIQYMRSLGAHWPEVFFKISLPWSLPYIFAALKISITLAVVGAVVGEFVASDFGPRISHQLRQYFIGYRVDVCRHLRAQRARGWLVPGSRARRNTDLELAGGDRGDAADDVN